MLTAGGREGEGEGLQDRGEWRYIQIEWEWGDPMERVSHIANGQKR